MMSSLAAHLNSRCSAEWQRRAATTLPLSAMPLRRMRTVGLCDVADAELPQAGMACLRT